MAGVTKAKPISILIVLSAVFALACALAIIGAPGANAASNETGDTATPLKLNRPAPVDLTSTTNDYTLSGGGCFSGVGQSASTAQGGDVVYSFTAPNAGSYSFRVINNLSIVDPVLYVAGSLPPGAGPQVVATCLGAANRNAVQAAEEVSPLNLTAGQNVFVVVDENIAANGTMAVLVERSTTNDAEPNGTPATASALPPCGARGSIDPAADVDFYSLGTPPAESRLFALIDGAAGNGSNVDLRVTTATDTLEFDQSDSSFTSGNNSPLVAGTPLTGAASFLRVTHNAAGSTHEPYRVYSVVRTPIGSAAAEVEPNEITSQATSLPSGYAAGTLGAVSDVDVFAIELGAGARLFLSLDADPLRDNTPFDATLELLDPSGNVVATADDDSFTSETTASPGTLIGTTPFSPAEGLSQRVATSGTYFAKVSLGFGASIGDYLLSAAINCGAQVSLAISPESIPSAIPGTFYNQALSTSSGEGPYEFDLTSGALPAGISLSSDGVLSGTPTAKGSFGFRIRAADLNGNLGHREYTLNVAAAPGPGPAKAPSPQPEAKKFARKVTLSYDRKREVFKGKLTSPGASACAARERVTIYRQEKGKDPKIGADKTSEKGRFEVSEEKPAGTYYAVAKASAEDAGQCLKSHSKSLKLG